MSVFQVSANHDHVQIRTRHTCTDDISTVHALSHLHHTWADFMWCKWSLGNTAKPETTVWDHVTTSVSMKPLEIFYKTSRHFLVIEVEEKKGSQIHQSDTIGKPLTTVQHFTPTFVSMKPLDIFSTASGSFQLVFVVTEVEGTMVELGYATILPSERPQLRDCVQTFMSVKPLDIFNKMLRHSIHVFGDRGWGEERQWINQSDNIWPQFNTSFQHL